MIEDNESDRTAIKFGNKIEKKRSCFFLVYYEKSLFQLTYEILSTL